MNQPINPQKTCSCGHGKETNSNRSESLTSKENDLPIMLALLPCGLRNAFQQAVFAAFPGYADQENPKLIIDGNLNYEKKLYSSIDGMTSMDELPDILITSDINSLYHKDFVDKYLNSSKRRQ